MGRALPHRGNGGDDRLQLRPASQPDQNTTGCGAPDREAALAATPRPSSDRQPLAMPASTVHAVLVRCTINRLSRIDRVSGEPLRRYEHNQTDSLIHVDVSKFGNIPDGGGMAISRQAAWQEASQEVRPSDGPDSDWPHRHVPPDTSSEVSPTASAKPRTYWAGRWTSMQTSPPRRQWWQNASDTSAWTTPSRPGPRANPSLRRSLLRPAVPGRRRQVRRGAWRRRERSVRLVASRCRRPASGHDRESPGVR
jgi:hypothetical protein